MAVRRHRRRLRPLACCGAILLGLAAPETALPSSSHAAPHWWSKRRAPAPQMHPAPPPAGRLTQPRLDDVWSRVKIAMAPCDRAFAAADLRWRAAGEPPGAGEAATARERCAAAIVDVGAVPLPPTDQAGVAVLLEQARDGCQRSMAEKQLSLTAMRALPSAAPDSLAAYEARLRIAAGPRSTLNCAASFAAVARAARLRFPELELAASEPL